MNIKRIIGLVLSLMGIVFLLVSISGVTGFAIAGNMNITNQNMTVIGLILVIIGVIIFELSFKKFKHSPKTK